MNREKNMKQENIHKKCSDLVQERFQDRIKDILITDEDAPTEDDNYIEGLSFDWVKPKTWPDQLEGYWRWQLSWGGPSDEFRIFVNPDQSVHRIEYWYLDWFDGASVTLDPKLHHDAWERLSEVHGGRLIPGEAA